jgi:hypothetical protein
MLGLLINLFADKTEIAENFWLYYGNFYYSKSSTSFLTFNAKYDEISCCSSSI